MEVYERETQEVIRRFLDHRITIPECIAALDAALAGLIPTLIGEQLPRLRVVMLANNEIVMKEMARRGAPGKARHHVVALEHSARRDGTPLPQRRSAKPTPHGRRLALRRDARGTALMLEGG